MLRKGIEGSEGKAVVWVCEVWGVAPTSRCVRKIRDEQRAPRTIEGSRPYRLAKGLYPGRSVESWFIFWVVPARSVKRAISLSYLKVKEWLLG